MHVKPFGVTLTFSPRDDVRGAQKGRVGDACQGAAAVPVPHQAGAEDVLADPLHDQALGFGCAWQLGYADFELAQWRIREADAERIDPIQRRVDFAQLGKGVSGFAGAGHDDSGQSELRDDASMVERQEPRAVDAAGG